MTTEAEKFMIEKLQKMENDGDIEFSDYDTSFMRSMNRLLKTNGVLNKKQSNYLFTLFHNS